MQTIRITITSEKPASVAFIEQKPETKEAKRKTMGERLETLFKLKTNDTAMNEVGKKGGK